MKLYYSPGACSMGIHILLEEIGKPFETAKLDLKGGEQSKPPFSDINPKGKVPTLQRDDGSILTEFPVIATYLARTNPDAKLLPHDPEAELRAAEAMDYCVATIHMQGFARLFRPTSFAQNEADQEAVKARGKEIAAKGFALMDKQLAGKEWVAGDYSVADSALFYVEYWGAKRMGMTLPTNCAAHLDRMMARPAVKRMVAQEGLPRLSTTTRRTLTRRAFWFLRHGETDWNARGVSQGNVDIPLNPTGLAQAAGAALLLRHRGIAAIVSSPLSRARETALAVGAQLGLPVEVEDELREVRFGVQEGQAMGAWFDGWLKGELTPAGAEPFEALRARAVRAINRALERPAPVLVVAHGALFRAVRAEMGLGDQIRTPNAVPYFCEPGSPWSLQAA